MKIFGWSLLMGLMLLVLPVDSQAQAKFMMTSVRNAGGEITSWNFGCPKDGNASAMVVGIDKVNIPDDMIDHFGELVDAYEREQGVYVKSESRVRDAQLEKDEVKTMTEGPYNATAKAFCDIVRENYKRK